MEEKLKAREVLFGQKEYIDQFLKSEHAQKLNGDELAIINSWKYFEKGSFFIYKHLKNHSIFLDGSSKPKALTVSGIFDPIVELFPFPPVVVEAVLLPFKGRIIYDGMMMGYSIFLGPGIRRCLKDTYEKAKRDFGLITQLPWGQA